MRLSRAGVATYVQTFVLVAVAIGGSFAVYRTVGAYSNQPSPGVAILEATIRQGASSATESLTVANTGQGTIQTFTLLNPGLSASASYCYTAWNPVAGVLVSATCPAMAANPSSVLLSLPLAPSSSMVLLLTLAGASVFTLGMSYPVVVLASNGAESAVNVVAEQA